VNVFDDTAPALSVAVTVNVVVASVPLGVPLTAPVVVLNARPTAVSVAATRRQNSSSNDIGDITWVVPTGTIRFPAVVPGIQAHHWSAGITPTMSIGHKGAVTGAKVMAASILDLLTSPDLRAAAKKQFEMIPKTQIFFALPRREAAPRSQ
jgi:aminobenzoyl-glutamate utilization protein B